MNARVQRLRNQSLEATPSLSIERALLVTDFYKENDGRHSTPVLRAMNFRNLCEKQDHLHRRGRAHRRRARARGPRRSPPSPS